MSPDGIYPSLQENLLICLVHSTKASQIIRNAVDRNLFSTQVFRTVVGRVYDYLDEYKQPPAEHLPDLLEPELNSPNGDASLYNDLVRAIDAQKDKIHEDYVLNQLERFVRGQTLKSSIILASEAVQAGDLDQAEKVLEEQSRPRMQVFRPGITLAEGLQIAYNREVRRDVLTTGIPQLDKSELGPGRGEFHLFIGPPKAGKSWWLVHITKRCLLHRYKVAYLTLELSEAQITQRVLQALFSLTKLKAAVQITRINADSLGRITGFGNDKLTDRPAIYDHGSKSVIEKKMSRIRGINQNLMVRQFPAGALTVAGVRSYLDMMDRVHHFVPDFLVIDYPDYMKIDPRNYRIDVGNIYNELRGIAVERDMGVVVASRSNREGAQAKLVTDIHAAEDFSRIYTADTVLTYTQTMQERQLGLARIFVSSSRVADRDRFVVLISQSYPIGQFALDSAEMSEQYWGHLSQMSNEHQPIADGEE